MVSMNTCQPVAGERNTFGAQEETFPPCQVCEMPRGAQGGWTPKSSDLAPEAAAVPLGE